MSFVSYSQNAEDVLLNRLFGDQFRGFYIDVGAAHPIDENDTYALYLRGWRGINIEPNKVFFNALENDRPEDCNLNVALSAEVGRKIWYEVKNTGLSTLVQEEADRQRDNGREVIPHDVEISTLVTILERHLGARTDIDLLKVDVEGLEYEVLLGNDWERYRPKIIMVEATIPESPVRRDTPIRQFLAERGYQFRYFDGLNDYFSEMSFDTGDAFERPVNIFDQYITRSLNDANNKLAAAEKTIDGLRTINAGSPELIDALKDMLMQNESSGSEIGTGEVMSLIQNVERALADVISRDAPEQLPLLNLLGLPEVGQRSVKADEHDPKLPEILLTYARLIETKLAQSQSRLDNVIMERERLKTSVEQLRSENLSWARSFEATQAPEKEYLPVVSVNESEVMLKQLIQSRSWKITKPYRALGRLLKGQPMR